MKITFTKEEYDMLAIQAERLALSHKEQAAKPSDRLKVDYTTSQSLCGKFPKTPLRPLDYEVQVNRRELRKIEDLMEASIQKLNENVIPGYEARIEKDPSRADFYRDYIVKLKELREGIWKPILEKVKDAL